MRLFAGLPLPQSGIDRLAALRLRLAAPDDGLRWSSPEQWHITLKFFGEMSEQAAVALEEPLRSLEATPAEVRLNGLGLFGAKGILFASVFASPSLTALHVALESCAEAAGLPAERRSFQPHITLARSRNRTGLNRLQKLSRPALPSFGADLCWQAQEFVLYESVLEPHGAVYHPRLVLPLA